MRRKYQTFPAKAENPYRKSKNGISSWQRIQRADFRTWKRQVRYETAHHRIHEELKEKRGTHRQ